MTTYIRLWPAAWLLSACLTQNPAADSGEPIHTLAAPEPSAASSGEAAPQGAAPGRHAAP